MEEHLSCRNLRIVVSPAGTGHFLPRTLTEPGRHFRIPRMDTIVQIPQLDLRAPGSCVCIHREWDMLVGSDHSRIHY